ncbi:uncharacterized protein AMSG_11140 [Thecamonas trahens ATCC 50062]|uniref:Uncharacterized protein n=1 Tax=Thecamonas trahens ATCC 50062 TaxID=461836 RepID=A0A0L0DW50_THETB|nr:hypothetical protein AMSG_11140 [Thecamonas trahens ATCC 50062]KNC55743.1 hypothetical protein AMSG_11140 [Thecamonas trahens ATCC 50062]|eukprot:XP_013752896.1 hypothetical protein AMSG_11140 [Thecamonas trahens ATCC 50062]
MSLPDEDEVERLLRQTAEAVALEQGVLSHNAHHADHDLAARFAALAGADDDQAADALLEQIADEIHADEEAGDAYERASAYAMAQRLERLKAAAAGDARTPVAHPDMQVATHDPHAALTALDALPVVDAAGRLQSPGVSARPPQIGKGKRNHKRRKEKRMKRKKKEQQQQHSSSSASYSASISYSDYDSDVSDDDSDDDSDAGLTPEQMYYKARAREKAGLALEKELLAKQRAARGRDKKPVAPADDDKKCSIQ